jgi:hypothetical protein
MFENKIDSVEFTEEMKVKTAKETHSAIQVVPSFEKTYLIVAAIHKNPSNNYIHKVSCKKGIPINGYTYDSQTDSYHVDCADYLHLGYIPISFLANIKDCSFWKTRVPMSENVIKKYLTILQKKELKNFKNHFKTEHYEIHFIQMIDPN